MTAPGQPLAHSEQEHGFSQDEVTNLKEIFDLFDKEQRGFINTNDLETIMGSLQRNPDEIKDHISELGSQISFDQFIALMQAIENKIVADDNGALDEDPTAGSQQQLQQDLQPVAATNIQADSKVLDFLRLLEEYRRKCEEQGNYAEARKAAAKYEELLRKETQR